MKTVTLSNEEIEHIKEYLEYLDTLDDEDSDWESDDEEKALSQKIIDRFNGCNPSNCPSNYMNSPHNQSRPGIQEVQPESSAKVFAWFAVAAIIIGLPIGVYTQRTALESFARERIVWPLVERIEAIEKKQTALESLWLESVSRSNRRLSDLELMSPRFVMGPSNTWTIIPPRDYVPIKDTNGQITGWNPPTK